MTLPERGASRAILIGAHAYSQLGDLGGVKGNIEALYDFLRRPDGWNLPDEHCLSRPQPVAAVPLLDELWEVAATARDTLLVYYAGHGHWDPDHASRLYLGLPSSRLDRLYQWIDYEYVSEAVLNSPAARKLVILDCCYAGRALDGRMSGVRPAAAGESLINLADMDGTCVLTAASGAEPAMCPPGATYSSFTGELLALLEGGAVGPVPGDPNKHLGEHRELLTVATGYSYLRQRLSVKRAADPLLPEPQIGTRNNGGDIVLAPNRAYAGTLAPPTPTLARAPGPTSLTAPAALYVGRESELAQVMALGDEVLAPDGRPAICLVHGMGGIGKSELLSQAAARLKDQFPDGQLEINLHGFEPEIRESRNPDEALESLLSLIGHPKIPASPDARQEEWRSWLAGRRVLLLLDNAHDAGQIRPLLPGQNARCLTLVSSRNQDIDADRKISLTGLPEQAAIELLKNLARPEPGVPEIRAERGELAQLARRCGYLPVALSTVGAFLYGKSTTEMLDAMGGPNPLLEVPRAEVAVRLAFRASYDRLPADLRETLWHCAWHPGREYSTDSIAAMMLLTAGAAKLRLDRLMKSHLLQEGPTGVTFHDLFLSHARTVAEPKAAAHRHQARGLLYAHLLAQLSAAHLSLFGATAEREAEAGTTRFGDPSDAVAWLRSRSSELEAAATAALNEGWDRAQRLAIEAGRWLRYNERNVPADELLREALDLAVAVGDRLGQTSALTGIAHTHLAQDEYREARERYREALDLAVAVGDRLGQTSALTGIADTHLAQGEYREARERYREALDLAVAVGDSLGQTSALTGIADTHRLQDEYREARERYREALDLAVAVGNRLGQTSALTG
ncbi:tetratricopeptide repeat protein, partial [Streptomyces sp. NPDC057137]|uniref:caspase, EACC1-associated type n=1 Tax=Streptomyces sp. NPDC057137 TaxID=3346030 RepID=UPI003640BB07